MIEPSLIYWAEVVEGIKVMAGVPLILSATTFIIMFVLKNVGEGCVKITPAVIALIISAAVTILLPSQKTIYMMAGATAINSADLGPEAAKVRKLINQKLDEALEVEDEK